MGNGFWKDRINVGNFLNMLNESCLEFYHQEKAPPMKTLKVHGKLTKGQQGQDQGNRGHAMTISKIIILVLVFQLIKQALTNWKHNYSRFLPLRCGTHSKESSF